MSIDLLVEEARDTDRTGYAASTLREMLHEKRTLQIRAMVAFAKALDIDIASHEEYQLRLVRYLTDDSIHEMDAVHANLKQLRIAELPRLTEEEVREIPISHRQERQGTIEQGSATATPTKRRISGN